MTDKIPDCKSEVIGDWIIVIQDAMPAKIRDSAEWRELLPLAAGTGRAHEQERADILLEWMWSQVLPQLSDVAEAHGFGREWQQMLAERTAKAAAAAMVAAAAAAAGAAAVVAAVAVVEAAAPDTAKFWSNIDPIGTLKKLVEVGQ